MNRDDMKPALDYDSQVDLLISRGLCVIDKIRAKEILQQTNYYRLSAYSLGLRDENIYHEGVTIERIYNLYCFDENLRQLLFGIIEPIEIRLRSEISYYLANTYGNVSHLNSNIVKDRCMYYRFLSDYYGNLKSMKKYDFVAHNIDKYGELPIWAVVEMCSFGSLSMYYSNMLDKDKKAIADVFGVSIAHLPGWLECLCEIRNICAHSGRIYNKILLKKPKLYSEHEKYLGSKIFKDLLIIKKLYQKCSDKWDSFYNNLIALIDAYPDVNMKFIDFPHDWKVVLK